MEELYNELVFVSLRTPSREERRVRLRITVAVHSHQSRGKELAVRLTDDEDLLFLFTLQLGEDDFQSLKSQQGLLVDFGAFPQNLMDLLRLCREEESKDFPKFLLAFTISEHDCGISHLNVIETNSFKHLTHLSLKFLLGNDIDVKKYLAGCLTSLKEENLCLKEKLQTTKSELNTRLGRSEEALAARNRELSTLREEFANKSSSMISRHSQDVMTEREKTIQIQSSCQKKFDQDKRELESSHKAVVHELQNKLSKLSVINNELNEGKFRLESCIRDLKNKVALLEEECRRSRAELTKLRRDNTSLDVERHERDKTLNHLRTRIAVLEQEVKDDQEVITRTKELLNVANEQKRNGNETLVERHQQLNKSAKTIKSISEELIKGNEIILRIQKELRNARAKNKLNSTVIAQQEKVISEKTTTLEKQSNELTTSQADIKKKETEIKALTESLETATEKLEESKQLLRTNENVINWLNKQMNEQCISQSKFGSAAANSVGSNTAIRSNFNANLALPHSTPLSFGSGALSTHTYVPRYTSQAQNECMAVLYRGILRRSPVPVSRYRTDTNSKTIYLVVYRPCQKPDQRTPTIPEERLKTSPHILSTNMMKPGKENNPLIDPKYLTKPNQKPNLPRPLSQTQNKQDTPNGPPSSQPQPTIPLMSAYFPTDASSVKKNESSLL